MIVLVTIECLTGQGSISQEDVWVEFVDVECYERHLQTDFEHLVPRLIDIVVKRGHEAWNALPPAFRAADTGYYESDCKERIFNEILDVKTQEEVSCTERASCCAELSVNE